MLQDSKIKTKNYVVSVGQKYYWELFNKENA